MPYDVSTHFSSFLYTIENYIDPLLFLESSNIGDVDWFIF